MNISSNKQIKLGALISYIAIIFNIGSGLIYTPWMISKIGQVNYGLYTLATSFIGLFVMDFGLGSAIMRYLSKYLAEKNEENIKNFMGLIQKLYLFLDLIIFCILLILYFFINVIYSKLTPNEINTFKILYIIVSIFAVTHFPFITVDGIMTSYEKFIELKFLTLLNRILTILLMIFCLLKGYGVYALVSVNAAVGILIIIIKIFIIKNKTNLKINLKYYNKNLLFEIFSLSIWVTVCLFANRFVINLMPTIISAVSITGAIGISIFGLAGTIEGFIHTFGTAITGLFIPKISRIVTQKNSEKELNTLSVKIGRIQFIIVCFVVIFWCCFGKSFIVDIWNRGEFVASYLCSVFIIIPSMFYLPIEIGDNILLVLNKMNYKGIIFIMTAILNIIIAIPMVKFYGPLGGCISIFISIMFRTLCFMYIYHNKLKLNMIEFTKNVFVKLSPLCIIMLIMGFLLEQFNPINNKFIKFGINSIMFFIIYLTLMLIFGMNKFEKDLVISPIKQILRIKYK